MNKRAVVELLLFVTLAICLLAGCEFLQRTADNATYVDPTTGVSAWGQFTSSIPRLLTNPLDPVALGSTVGIIIAAGLAAFGVKRGAKAVKKIKEKKNGGQGKPPSV